MHLHSNCHAQGNVILFRQVIHNLIKNALHSIKQKGHGRIFIRTYTEGEQVYISVADEGVGISPKNIEKIFDPYYNFNKTGNGLGLAFCKRAISQMGGNIFCNSEKDILYRS